MVEKTTIPMTIPFTGYSSAWGDFKSDNVECAGLVWHVTGSYRVVFYGVEITKAEIHCAAIGGKETSIWKCDAWGEIQFMPEPNFPQLLVPSVLWLHSYDFRYQRTSSPVAVGREFVGGTNFFHEEDGKKFVKLEVSVNVNVCAKIDLSDSGNEMIQSPEDAAKVTVGGETLWVSKSILGAFSPFFKALFNSDFKEKREGLYKLEDIKLAEFKHFVSLLYGLAIPVNASSVEYLLRLADMYQCSAITNRCRTFLISSDSHGMPAVRKLQLADRYGLVDVVKAAILKLAVAELKECTESTLVMSCSSLTNVLLMKRLKDYVKT